MRALALAPPPLPTTTAYREATEKFNQICAQLQGAPTQMMTHSELESLLESEGRELLRRLLQAHLDERGPGTTSTPVVDAQGGSGTPTNGGRSARWPVCLAPSA